MFAVKLLKTCNTRLYSSKNLVCYSFSIHSSLLSEKRQCYHNKRHFSLQSTVESVVRTQSGIFKAISESAPVECIQKSLVTIHDTSGLPWWATIVCTTILFRTSVTLPLAIYQNYIMAKLENLKLEMPLIVEELKRETAMAIKMYKWDEKMAKITYNRSIKKQWNNLIIRDNCHPFKASLLFWFQIPMWISFSVSLRNLVYVLPERTFQAQMTFTELTLGGFGWIPNLIEVDASWIFPVALGIINLAIIEIQSLSRVNPPSKFQNFITNLFRGFSIIMIPIGASVPSCLVLYWTTSSTYGLIQNLVLMSPKVKRFCRIPKTDKELKNPYKHVINKFQEKYTFISGVNKVT
ncbi:unnamed protein product [Brassicogethes aeneus]|uniref:Membrane insertase YidC/Oxa/ALB C-terminal domain-containing protein n=1 Tax=Brassicogethes aeneus TaxID=1431903 RepID=A0A9P0ATI1_BRAAE|nr:unnamed protein product [Brassicogethes aeneus]